MSKPKFKNDQHYKSHLKALKSAFPTFDPPTKVSAAPPTGSTAGVGKTGSSAGPVLGAGMSSNIAALEALLDDALIASVPLGGPVPEIKIGEAPAVVSAFLHCSMNGPFGVRKIAEWTGGGVDYKSSLASLFKGKLTNAAWKSICIELLKVKNIEKKLRAVVACPMVSTYGDVWPNCDLIHTRVVAARNEALALHKPFDQAAFIKIVRGI